MLFEEQHKKIEILKVPAFDQEQKKLKHGPLLPSCIRAVFVGSSACGKTQTLLSLLTNPNGLRFKTIYLYSSSFGQKKYEFLEKVLEKIDTINFYKFSNCDEVIDPSQAETDSIFVFDDLIFSKNQTAIQKFFCAGRHFSVDVIYLAQSYAYLKKHLLRDNTNLLVIFAQDKLNLKHIYEDHVINDMSFNEFQNLCNEIWKEKYCFLVIDKESPLNNGRYRKTFNNYLKWTKT